MSNHAKAALMEELCSPTSPLPYVKEVSQVYASGWPPSFWGDLYYYLADFDIRGRVGEEGGWLMATGSEHSVGVPHTHAGAYTASKHAVLALCDVLRGELPAHVGISVVCPGLTSSRLWEATRHRPGQYGGAAESDPASGMLMEQKGMSAATVAQRAFDGIAAGRFLIPTHYHVRRYAQKRAEEMAEAFELLAEIDTTDYDLATVVAQFRSEAAG
ncbi:MAG: SDR family NAD(P)-dependent oxidoreductase [bacterium]|nr:SDR family NAD(P)-dependent oxidoreductase [bacterium]